VVDRLGSGVRDVKFDRGCMYTPAMTPSHHRAFAERTAGPIIRLVDMLEVSDPAKLESFRQAYDALVVEYWVDNQVRQDFLLTRGTKI
jgi:hypothetical protein